MEHYIDKLEKRDKLPVFKLLIIFFIIGFIFLGFMEKEHSDTEVEVVSIHTSLNGLGVLYSIFFRDAENKKGFVKFYHPKNIKVGEKLVVIKAKNYFGFTATKYIRKKDNTEVEEAPIQE